VVFIRDGLLWSLWRWFDCKQIEHGQATGSADQRQETVRVHGEREKAVTRLLANDFAQSEGQKASRLIRLALLSSCSLIT
jgi:hypothetical protein